MNIRTLDLNLLKVLDALLREGSTTGAARRLGLSQPAVSSALGRLRVSLGDPLFVRQGARLAPTDFARALEGPLHEALEGLATLLDRGSFDPATATDRFLLAGSDFFAEMLMPALARRLLAEAPGVRVQLVELVPDDYLRGVRQGTADLALVPGFALQDWAERRHLFTSRFAVIARRGHPQTQALTPGATMPLDVFCRVPQVLFSVEGKLATQGDAALAEIGRARHVVMTLPDFSGVYRTVAESDLISLIPAELAARVADQAGLDLFAPPVPVGPVPIFAAWHRRSHANPAHAWLRERVAEIAADWDALPSLREDREAAIPGA